MATLAALHGELKYGGEPFAFVILTVVTRRSAGIKKTAERSSSTGLILIGAFKVVKGLLLVAVAIGVLKLLHKDIAEVVTRWVESLRVDPDNRFIHAVLSKVFSVTPKQLKELSAGTFIYAGLLLTEGTGLLLQKRWAEYFTVVTTAALIPLEIFEVFKHFSAMKVALLAGNILIVWYLVGKVRTKSEKRRNQ
jgi:uncharacterized membrane protein (DUF2068 family)